MTAYYNEHDPFAVAWLRELIADGQVAAGHVDERDIRDVLPSDLDRYDQCHFFAGIGGWAYALRLAGWPDDRPVWTGSCPCQPFSAAGRGGRFSDERHLWPAFFHLIGECRPAIVFGEQVASKDGLGWLDLVQSDLEGAGYAFGAADLCAAGVGAPHIRQRLFWVADACFGERQAGRGGHRPEARSVQQDRSYADGRGPIVLAYANGGNSSAKGLQRSGQYGQQPEDGLVGFLGDARHGERASSQFGVDRSSSSRGEEDNCQAQRAGDTDPWSDLIWLPCRDGKARPAQPGIQPLAHGVLNRVGTLRGAGNAIVPQVAAEFVKSYLDVCGRSS